MKKKECPGCAVEVEHDAVICPVCGYEFPKQSPLTKGLAVLFIVLLLIWLLF